MSCLIYLPTPAACLRTATGVIGWNWAVCSIAGGFECYGEKMCLYGFKEITIEDKALFNQYIMSKKTLCSDECFSIFFTWRDYFCLRYTEFNGYLCVVSTTDRMPPFAFLPIGAYDKKKFYETILFLRDYFEYNNCELRFRLVPDYELDKFTSLEGFDFEYSLIEGLSDYIYNFDDFVSLRGNKYQDKRHQINSFLKNYSFECVAVGEKEIPECMEVLQRWYSETKWTDEVPKWENQAAKEFLNNYDKLGCKSTLIRIDDQPKAFVITEMLNEETVVSHVEKADRNVKGLYALLNQLHYRNEYNGAKYINLEEDLCIPGLIKSKQSYRPSGFVHKYEITLRQ